MSDIPLVTPAIPITPATPPTPIHPPTSIPPPAPVTPPSSLIVYDLKFVGPLEFELVAPMPEQLKATTMHFYEAPRNPY